VAAGGFFAIAGRAHPFLGSIVAPTVSVDAAHAPLSVSPLGPFRPNPFQSATELSFRLDVADRVSIHVFDLAGREVATPLDRERFAAGEHRVMLRARLPAAGVYLCRLTTSTLDLTRRLVFLP